MDCSSTNSISGSYTMTLKNHSTVILSRAVEERILIAIAGVWGTAKHTLLQNRALPVSLVQRMSVPVVQSRVYVSISCDQEVVVVAFSITFSLKFGSPSRSSNSTSH